MIWCVDPTWLFPPTPGWMISSTGWILNPNVVVCTPSAQILDSSALQVKVRKNTHTHQHHHILDICMMKDNYPRWVNTRCPATASNLICARKCMKKPSDGVLRPSVEQFNRFLPDFLGNRPDLQCPKGCVSYPHTYKDTATWKPHSHCLFSLTTAV